MLEGQAFLCNKISSNQASSSLLPAFFLLCISEVSLSMTLPHFPKTEQPASGLLTANTGCRGEAGWMHGRLLPIAQGWV